jgi:glutamine cyclotransferase
MKRFITFCALAVVVFSGCKNKKAADEENQVVVTPRPATMGYTIIKAYPHETTSFTEGLFWLNNEMYESVGEYATSFLLKAKLETGKPIKSIKLDAQYFGEGISMLNNKIYQLTYQQHKVFVYDMNFKKTGEFEWPFEGWGMTTDGKQLIVNTGGSNLYFVNPETFKIERTLPVYNNAGYVDSINEMEYVNGYIYANRWLTNSIIKINAKTGQIEAIADLSDIFQRSNLVNPNIEGSCLNGIAYDEAKKSFYVTGKYWPNLFEIRLTAD